MTLSIYNTFAKQKEPFTPVRPPAVSMYVCGITPYDKPHLGHARSSVVFDCVRRYLNHIGYQVNYVQNFTDIDDKIIERSQQSGVPIETLVHDNIELFYACMDRLAVLRATHAPRVTAHIPDIVAFIERLIERVVAYAVGGNVYFAVRSFHDYGRLSHREIDELKTGVRVEREPDKRDPLDFALWKKSDEPEPGWESPWGRGRPGWHIECSTMSTKYLGAPIDIHGGGQDLVFPHHENEIAQSESYTGTRWVRYWMHNGFVTIHKEKMSKSVGNVFAVDALLAQYHPMAVRLFLLSQHYRSPIDYSDTSVMQAAHDYARVNELLYDIRFAVEQMPGEIVSEDITQDESLSQELRKFTEAMDDDFNTARALGALHTALHRLAGTYRSMPRSVIERSVERIVESFALLGISFDLGSVPLSPEEHVLIERRESARRSKDWAASDQLRGELATRGILVEDTPTGPRWKRKK